MIKLILILSSLLIFGFSYDSKAWYSVVKGDRFTIVPGKQVDGSLAWGVLDDGVYTDGWAKLTLKTNSFQNFDQAAAAGYLEGALLSTYIYYHKINYFQQWFDTSAPDVKLVEFLLQQYEYTNQQVAKNYQSSNYWKTVGLWHYFLQGLITGYNDNVTKDKQLSLSDFLLIQAIGDMFDLKTAIDMQNGVETTDWKDLSLEEFNTKFLLNTHCSVLIKIADDLSDVFMGHNSWNQGHVMLRTYKFYQFGSDVDMQMTSYPGQIYSLDDYYILNLPQQKLYVTETSNNVFNKQVYLQVTYESLLCWQRVLVANVLATNGFEWTSIFSQYNSGTYNNQYMVIDTKSFIPGIGAKSGFLWIVEQLPGLIVKKDVTNRVIKQGNYWASYNIPYFSEIFTQAGYEIAVNKAGDDYLWDKCPRAKIFAREHKNVQTFEAYKTIMRYNKFATDEFSRGDPTKSISARGDLYPEQNKRKPFFAYDAKATSWIRITEQNGLSDIQNGPTYDDQPIFKWSNFNFSASHIGQPDEWHFPWISVTPEQ